MTNKLKDKYTKVLEKIINTHIAEQDNIIFVLIGITSYINIDKFTNNICDITTFDKEGNLEIFNNKWFESIFSKIAANNTYQILSHQQYASINAYLNDYYFNDRIVLVYDNLRVLYPINENDYIEKTDDTGSDTRPETLPVYQAEQKKIKGHYYYSFKSFNDNFRKVPFFSQKKELSFSQTNDDESNAQTLDIISDPYGIDIFVNECLETNNFKKQVYVKSSGINILNESQKGTLQELNYLLSDFGGGVHIKKEEAIESDYSPTDESFALLKQYWGENATFRNIKIYKSPDANNDIIPISQGMIVDTIIKEYNNAHNGIQPRDIFITAPTGAGKSLIFQLPAFYAAKQVDITIVVSPLKALMDDQVRNLRNERRYYRVEALNSDLTLLDRDQIIENCKRGDVDILYLSPELLLSYNIHYFIGNRRLGLLVVDEAHLITTWGRDFRVDYWFLGNHINKVRKGDNYMFPIVALTATAVYGGTNDMVFDSINSLNMHNPHMFIGNVRRDNIEFVIDNHDDYSIGTYDQNKENETVSIINGLNSLGLKTIVYAPYTKHVKNIKEKCDQINNNIAVAFYGSLNRDEKEHATSLFKSDQCKIMIATKAFGMGVDIPNIQVVYHHAPSGLLPDYIQEIGRAARNKNIHGFAALTFSKSDLRYSKQLFGISSLRAFQLKAILRKIILYFKRNGHRRNMLMSATDFAYIFNATDDVDQKVSTALMMIEKDYLAKTRFNVLIARPKKLFTKVYARTNQDGLNTLTNLYQGCFHEINHLETNTSYHFLELDLDKIWSKHFCKDSFPKIKNDFYNGQFLAEQGIRLDPIIKITINIDHPYQQVLTQITTVLNAVSSTFDTLRGDFFTENEFSTELSSHLENFGYDLNKITSFILSAYSQDKVLENDAFLQQRRYGTGLKYRVFGTYYKAKFSQIRKILSLLFDCSNRSSVDRYLSNNNSILLKNYIRLGSLLEITELGSFETTGGKDPKIFLRLNDPQRIENDSNDANYSNSILDSVMRRHQESCRLFEHFFTNHFCNEDRWDIIEDFFLGMSNEDLFNKYPGTPARHIDILKHLKSNSNIAKALIAGESTDNKSHETQFPPRRKCFYSSKRLLTIGSQTKQIKTWITEDPVALHKTIKQNEIEISDDNYKVLSNRLKNNHFDYYRDFLRLRLFINFPGYDHKVEASVPYRNQPVNFYKWWIKNPNKVTMNFKEKIELFIAVDKEKPKVLQQKHRTIINQNENI